MLRMLRQQSTRWLVLLALLEVPLLTLSVKLASQVRYFGDAPALAGFSEYIWSRALLFALMMIGSVAEFGFVPNQ
jgi:hypothetical protein